MSLGNDDLSFVLGAPAPVAQQAAPVPVSTAPAGPAQPPPVEGEYIQPLSERVREAGKRAGIDTDKLGIDVSEFDYIMGKPDVTIGAPPTSFGDVIKGGSSTAASIQPGGAFAKPESFDPVKHSFLDDVVGGGEAVGNAGLDLAKGLVTDVLDGVSGYVDLWRNTFEAVGVKADIINATEALKLNPNDLAARAKLRALREHADRLDNEAVKDLWDIGTAAVVFAPFKGPVALGAKGLEAIGMKVGAKALTESLAQRGIRGTLIRLVDRAGKGAAMGGAYGFFQSEGDLETSKKSAEMMGALFGAGPAVAAPLKSLFGAAGKGTGRVINAFNQIPAIASVRKAIYDGPIGRNWDYIATRSEKVFEDFKLLPLITNMHVARIEASRIAGKWVAGMKTNLDAYTPEIHEHISALMERRMTPSALIAKLGQKEAAPIIRAAAQEQRRLKEVGRLLQAWGIPMHNSATGDLYNFVMRKNYMPHIIVNPETLVNDPKLRAQSIAAIAKKTGKSLQEAEADFLQWADRAKFDAANEASSGTIGRATMEARLYGLPGYSMDLPNVLNLYYQKAGRLLAFHRRLGRHVPDVNVWGGGDDAAAIADAPKPWGGPGGQMELFAPENSAPGTLQPGMKVVVEGNRGPIEATVVNPAANNKGQVRVRAGKGKGSKLLTVSGSKVRVKQEPLVQKAEELKGLKKGSDATLKGEPVKVKKTTRNKIVVEKPNGKIVEVPKDSPNIKKVGKELVTDEDHIKYFMKQGMSREEAMQLHNDTLRELGKPPYNGPRDTVPKMTAAAVKLEDGSVETGSFHGEIYDRVGDRAGGNPIDGFVDDAGNFYTREQASLFLEGADKPAQLRAELKRLGYTPKEIGKIIRGTLEAETGPDPTIAPPDPTQYVPPPPRRVTAVDNRDVGGATLGDAAALERLPEKLQRDVKVQMLRGKTFKEALIEARKGVRSSTKGPKDIVGTKKYQKPTVEKPGRAEAVAKNEGENLTSNPKLRGVGLTKEEEKVLKRMTDAGMSKQDALDIMFKSGKRKAANARPVTRGKVKGEMKKRKAS